MNSVASEVTRGQKQKNSDFTNIFLFFFHFFATLCNTIWQAIFIIFFNLISHVGDKTVVAFFFCQKEVKKAFSPLLWNGCRGTGCPNNLWHFKTQNTLYTIFENDLKCCIFVFFYFGIFLPIFVLLKLTCLVTLFDRQNCTIFGIFN